jgi:hypothetical protein
MARSSLLVGLVALLPSATLAQAQAGPAQPNCCECRSAWRFPVLAHLIRDLFPPPNALMPPQATVEASQSREQIVRMVAAGGYSIAEITAAKIKLDESQAKLRQEAVRYLTTADCHYYPEAEIGLISALRTDRSESVRLEAARGLGACRGTSYKVLEALHVCAMGWETDGNPSESSEKVRQAARTSLNRALTRSADIYPHAPPPAKPEVPTSAWIMPAHVVQPVGYWTQLPQTVVPPVSDAERALAETVGAATQPVPAASPRPSILGWVQTHLPWRQTNETSAQIRMRGLHPLGSDSLAIPGATPVRCFPLPYNEE